jgi:hypothetical protein
MADQSDVRRIALALPGTSEAEDHFAFSVMNRGKERGFVWAWNERIEPREPKVPSGVVVAVRVANLDEKEALLASGEEKLFTEPHYNGCPAVLVRLPMLEADELEELIVDAWRCQAPRSSPAALHPTLYQRPRHPPVARIPAGCLQGPLYGRLCSAYFRPDR